MADCLRLLHFHLGSQAPDIANIKVAMTELSRLHVELQRSGADLEYLDVGGGLGIDYDGTQNNLESSVNYTLEEYASNVVFHIKQTCDQASVPHPTIITESGRALVAFTACWWSTFWTGAVSTASRSPTARDQKLHHCPSPSSPCLTLMKA